MKDPKESETPSSGGFKFGSSAAEPEKPVVAAGFKFGSGSTSPSTPLGRLILFSSIAIKANVRTSVRMSVCQPRLGGNVIFSAPN